MNNDVLDNDLLIEKTETKHQYAGFWIRVGASLIDLVVYLPALGVNMYNLYFLKSLPLQIFTTVVLMVYKPWMEYQYGGTLGKMAVKIKVIRGDSQSITIQQSVIRNAPTLVSQAISLVTGFLLFNHPEFQAASSMLEIANLQNQVMSQNVGFLVSLFYIVSCVAVAFTATKQALHDMLAETFCIRY